MIYRALINKKYFGVVATGTTPSQQRWGLKLVDAINNISKNRVVVTGPKGVGKTHIINILAKILKRARVRCVSISCQKPAYALLKELVVGLNPNQKTNGYPFEGLEHLLEKTLTQTVSAVDPVYLFVNVPPTYTDTGDVMTFLTAVHKTQTRHQNLKILLAIENTSPLLEQCSGYARVEVPDITVDDIKELARLSANTPIADDTIFALAAAYALQTSHPFKSVMQLIRRAVSLKSPDRSLTQQNIELAGEYLVRNDLDTSLTPVILKSTTSPETCYLLVQIAASLIRQNNITEFSCEMLTRLLIRIDASINKEVVTKICNELVRSDVFKIVGENRFALSPHLTKHTTLKVITTVWDPFDPAPVVSLPQSSKELEKLPLTDIASLYALKCWESVHPHPEIPTHNTIYPLYLKICQNLGIQPKKETQFYAAIARLREKGYIDKSRDANMRGQPNLFLLTLTNKERQDLTHYYLRLTKKPNEKDITSIEKYITKTFEHAPSQKTVMTLILDLVRKFGKSVIRKTDLYKQYCSICSNPIKETAFGAILTKLVKCSSFLSKLHCFFQGSNETRIFINNPTTTDPPP